MVLIKNLLQTIFSKSCISCGKPGTEICQQCRKELLKINIQTCIVCERLTPNGKTHIACQTRYTPNKCFSIFAHTKTAKSIINKAKHHPHAYSNIDALITATTAIEIINKAIAGMNLIVPIPDTPKPLSKRLVKLPNVFANKIHETYDIPIYNILSKTSSTTQKGLNRRERFTNAQNSLMIRRNRIQHINNKNILLVDDTTTTGATLMQASKVLKKNGANKVVCLTITKDILERNGYV